MLDVNMEVAKIDGLKTNMVMCGDHPSFTKTELNMKETKPDGREKTKERIHLSYSKISPTTSGTKRMERVRSQHELHALETERVARSLVLMQRPDIDIAVRRNRALVQAAVGSFRWPPYLVAVWVLVLLLTHLLHCLVTVLDRALPTLKNVCVYVRSRAEEWWGAEGGGGARACAGGLACLTGTLYSVYFVLYGVHALALWSLEPLCYESTPALQDHAEPKITNYDDYTTTTNTTPTPNN